MSEEDKTPDEQVADWWNSDEDALIVPLTDVKDDDNDD